MKFLFRSSDGLCLPQALRVQSEGNKVKFSVDDPEYENAGNGLIDKIMNFPAAVDWADVVVYDPKDEELLKEADKVRLRKPVIGASELAGRIEHDRKFGIEFAKRAGIRVPEVKELIGPRAFREAKDFLMTKPRDTDWVFKVNGKAPEGIGTYVAKGGRSEMLRMLKYWEEQYHTAKISPDFVITTKIEGEEISTEAWFNGRDFFLPNHTLERNKFFNGDLGEKTGCSGNVVWATGQEAPLYQKLLAPLRSQLEDKFVGPIDVNVIIEKSSNEPVFLEFSPRFGYDAIFALMELFETDFGEFLYQIALGQPWSGHIGSDFAGDVRLHIPPFPAKSSKEQGEEAVGVPIFGLDVMKYNPHQHLVEVMLDRDEQPVTSGPHGYVLSVTAQGPTPKEAEDSAYKNVDKIRIPNMRYRTDLSEVIQEVYDKIDSTGWLGRGRRADKVLGLTQVFQPFSSLRMSHTRHR